MAEAETNLAINVIPGLSESFEVQGRGELQLGMSLLNVETSISLLKTNPYLVHALEPFGSVMAIQMYGLDIISNSIFPS